MEWHQFKQSSFLYLAICNSCFAFAIILSGLAGLYSIANSDKFTRYNPEVNLTITLAILLALLVLLASQTFLFLANQTSLNVARTTSFKRSIRFIIAIWFVSLGYIVFITTHLFSHDLIFLRPSSQSYNWPNLRGSVLFGASVIMLAHLYSLRYFMKHIRAPEEIFQYASFHDGITKAYLYIYLAAQGLIGVPMLMNGGIGFQHGPIPTFPLGAHAALLFIAMGAILPLVYLRRSYTCFKFWQTYNHRLESDAAGKLRQLPLLTEAPDVYRYP